MKTIKQGRRVKIMPVGETGRLKYEGENDYVMEGNAIWITAGPFSVHVTRNVITNEVSCALYPLGEADGPEVDSCHANEFDALQNQT